MKSAPNTKPATGDAIIGRTTFGHTPSFHLITDKSFLATASAVCENDSGQNDQNGREHAVGLLRVFQRHLYDDVPRVAAAIDHFFQEPVKVVQKNNLLRGVIAFEKITKPLQFEVVCIAFDALEFGVHLARRAGVYPGAKLFYHG